MIRKTHLKLFGQVCSIATSEEESRVVGANNFAMGWNIAEYASYPIGHGFE
jgi:hypothetical protein